MERALAPAFADYAHAAASYYAAQQQRGAFTRLLLAATSREAATLLVRSLHTFQVRASVSDVFVSADVGAVGAHLAAAAAGSSSMPFILVSVHDGNAAAVVLPLAVAVQSGAVRASRVVCTVVASDRSLDTFSALPALPLTLDVLFPSVYSEWWVEGSAIWQTMAALGAPMDVVGGHAAYLAPTLAYSLGDQLAANRVGGKGAAEVLYTARTASFADVPLGPFSNDTCSDAVVKSNAVDRACQCSKGFRLFRVHSVADWRARRPSTGYVYQMTTCGVLYLPLVESGAVDSTMTKVAIGVGVGGGLLLLTLGGALLLFAVFGGRNNRNAPTDATKAFSMAFTDIQASTMLWARTPALMSDAVEHHCSIVRALITQHKGYEVKTIGDSFMVAFVEAEDAARFGVELQEAMFSDEWWPAELDQHYREILEADDAHAVEDEGSSMGISGRYAMSMQSAALSLPPMKEAAAPAAPPNAPHDDVEYHSLWRGLRVRVGIHCGYGEIRKDPTTQGYDYFGTIVNTAARVEGVGHGGQTLVTAELCQRLGEGFVVGSGWAQVSLGPQSLRGLDEKVVLMQLLPTTLAGRRFPALRLDVEVIVSCSDGTGAKTLASASNGTVTAQGVEAMAVALCAETFRVNRAAKRQPGRGGDGEQSQSGTHVSQVSAVHNPVARANVVELLYQYHFLTSLFATSSEGWRRDAVRHLGERWQVRARGEQSAVTRSRILLQVALKAMLAQRGAAERAQAGGTPAAVVGQSASLLGAGAPTISNSHKSPNGPPLRSPTSGDVQMYTPVSRARATSPAIFSADPVGLSPAFSTAQLAASALGSDPRLVEHAADSIRR